MQKPAINVKHLVFIFDTLVHSLKHPNPAKAPALPYPSDLLDINAPLFVTWYIGKEKELRGCIGNFGAEKLSINLGRYAKISAFEDTRFNPISKSELPLLTANLSLLYNFQNRQKWDDWEIGVHGIEISFAVNGRTYHGTFLPEVAKSQGWSKEEAMAHLIKKAGYRQDYKPVLPLIQLETYESEKMALSYADYLAIKGEVGGEL